MENSTLRGRVPRAQLSPELFTQTFWTSVHSSFRPDGITSHPGQGVSAGLLFRRSTMEMQFDSKDQEILDQRMSARQLISRPRIGDYVRFSTGQVERFSDDGGDAFQTSPGGSFYLCGSGNASFSGGLNPSIPMDSLSLTDEENEGRFWFFHHGSAGAHRGVYFSVPCRVYDTSAPYNGYLTKGWSS